MPTTNQKAGNSGEYHNAECRLVATKPKRMLLSIKPTTEDMARRLLGAANRLDADSDVTQHFAEEVQRLS